MRISQAQLQTINELMETSTNKEVILGHTKGSDKIEVSWTDSEGPGKILLDSEGKKWASSVKVKGQK